MREKVKILIQRLNCAESVLRIKNQTIYTQNITCVRLKRMQNKNAMSILISVYLSIRLVKLQIYIYTLRKKHIEIILISHITQLQTVHLFVFIFFRDIIDCRMCASFLS
uniref:(northern house mosquito) hypothetical protein n=1 Tax=Culex pipiens TaxID=7175 RepID=A0A8D8DD15_CULPI